MPRGDGFGGRPAQRWTAAVLDTYGTICHLCGHPGAESGDHVVPRSDPTRGRELMYAVSNGRPAHHKPCPVCGVRCQTRRKDKPLTAAPPLDIVRFFDTRPRP